MNIKQRITPFLSYKDQAVEAAEFYVSVVPHSKIIRQVKNPANDSVLTVEFELSGMKFIALNAGRDWKFTEAMSLAIECDTQVELDALWESLIADGGAELACGWLRDKFGMCWQVWPSQLSQWMASDDPQAVQRMFEAVWQMMKLDIAVLQKAFEG
ncbi:MAG: VOC family protein [Pirellulaceae bacterium]|nr:VOC family protein [Pirellulaceae bacterium]